MKPIINPRILWLGLLLLARAAFSQQPVAKGVFLENLTWLEAEKVLTPETIVVIPLGAQSKEHGPHLPLGTDYLQSQYMAREIAKTEAVVIAPEVNYSFYFPFVTFPGSTSLRFSTAKSMVEDICRSLSAFGPKRFYIINEGIATNSVLKAAASALAREGILLTYTDLTSAKVDSLVKHIQQQKEGSHADEIETSKMLYMQPDKVNMALAKQEYGTKKGRGFPTRDSSQKGLYIPSGIYGDATLATKEKGKQIAEGMLAIMHDDVMQLRHAPVPATAKSNVTRYVGTYQTSDKKIVAISDQDGLVVAFNDLPQEKLHDEGNDYFAGFYFEVWFKANDAGEITAVRLTPITGATITATKIK